MFILLLASFLFYAFSGAEHALVLFGSIVWVHLLTRGPGIEGSRARLAAAVTLPALALVFYKYLGFLLAPFGGSGESETFSLFSDVLLPAGISFFVFQLISFAIDRYRGDIAEPPAFAPFALYISFFPQLVAGPIVRFHEVSAHLRSLSRYSLHRTDAGQAIAFICLGLVAKVLLADSLDSNLAFYVADPGGIAPPGAAFVVLAYSFQIYFDFFGYSLIAIGLGRLFGFHLPENFARPYEAMNPREFWRRWHMTLSFWIRDYLYLPLGGNRPYARNIVIVFAVCGLWHGAGWTFVVWGLFHGLLVIGYHRIAGLWSRWPAIVQRTCTFTLVSLGWTLFLFDFRAWGAFWRSAAGVAEARVSNPSLEMWGIVGVAALACFAFPYERWTAREDHGVRATAFRTVAAAAMVTAVLVFLDRSGGFIYFRF